MYADYGLLQVGGILAACGYAAAVLALPWGLPAVLVVVTTGAFLVGLGCITAGLLLLWLGWRALPAEMSWRWGPVRAGIERAGATLRAAPSARSWGVSARALVAAALSVAVGALALVLVIWTPLVGFSLLAVSVGALVVSASALALVGHSSAPEPSPTQTQDRRGRRGQGTL